MLTQSKPEHSCKADAEQRNRAKSPRKGGFYLDLKSFKKGKTVRESDALPEVQSFKKLSNTYGREEQSSVEAVEGSGLDVRRFPSFHNAWEYADFCVVPAECASPNEGHRGRERKRKKSAQTRKKNASGQRAKTKKEDVELVRAKEAEIEVLYPPANPLAKRSRDQLGPGGQAVVIYQRRNQRDYLHPQTGKGYRFEQIAFSGNCEATVDVVQSRRSLSEPRQHSPGKEVLVAKRRTRFQVEPGRMASTQSDFRSALGFLKQSNASVEFNKFEGVNRSFTRIFYENPSNEGSGTGFEAHEADEGKDGRESSTTTRVRLKQTAEKKLDLHREMMRAEKTSKKKFWESIERSLNYRCALAEMLSSQSFLSHNDSSKFFSTESSGGRSTNIYVRESVIEKISSYQGYQRFFPSERAGSRKKSENIAQTSSDTYRKMKTLLDSLLVKEDEEEEEEVHEEEVLRGSCLGNLFGFRSTSESTIIDRSFLLSQTASDKLSLLESNLMRSDTKSDLELLMSKLSEEIRRCSLFVGKLRGAERGHVTVNPSASDGKIEWKKGLESGTKGAVSVLSGWAQKQTVFPVSLRQSRDRLKSLGGDWSGSKNQIRFEGTRERGPAGSLARLREKPDERSRGTQGQPSNGSLFSLRASPTPSRETQSSKSTRSGRKAGEVLGCDDCKRLKKKILKLEKELEKIERRMPFYPVEYQNSIRCCLESLKVTSDTVLKRLKSCARLRYLESQQKKCHKEGGHHKRALSVPDAAVYKVADKQLSLRSSNSDYRLHVGMELTMENADPQMDYKLYSDASQCHTQEGNIQCRMFKENDEPLLVMDTDFSYNPQTGGQENTLREGRAFHPGAWAPGPREAPIGKDFAFDDPSRRSLPRQTQHGTQYDVHLEYGMLFKPRRNCQSQRQCPSDLHVPHRDTRESSSAISAKTPAKPVWSHPTYERIPEKEAFVPQQWSSEISRYGRGETPIPEEGVAVAFCDTEHAVAETKRDSATKEEKPPTKGSGAEGEKYKSKNLSESGESMRKQGFESEDIEQKCDKRFPSKSTADSRESLNKLRKRDDDDKDCHSDEGRRGETREEKKQKGTESRESVKHRTSIEDKEQEEKPNTQTVSGKPSEVGRPSTKNFETATLESKKLEEIALELKKLKEIALESKKLEGSASESKRPQKGDQHESMESDQGSRPCRKKDEKMVSRIPTRRKTTPSTPGSPSRKSSLLSTATTTESSVAERSCSSLATSKILVKSQSGVKHSVYRVFQKRMSEFSFYNKTTQTYGVVERPSNERKLETANVAVQTKCPVKHYGVQTTADSEEGTLARSSSLSGKANATSRSLSSFCQSLEEAFPRKPLAVSVALQVDRGARHRPTATVALQTNLPTEESLKYKNDLQIQKKVNMAIAELCFHLSETKERQEV